MATLVFVRTHSIWSELPLMFPSVGTFMLSYTVISEMDKPLERKEEEALEDGPKSIAILLYCLCM